ncbi:MAG: hypothetical protein P8I41_03820 [Flavobacteriaceae bacterium]|nr:hypothetical protein [Flavobacteriaceae bacterium]
MDKFISLFLFLVIHGFLNAQEYELPSEIDDNFIFFKSTDNKAHVLNNLYDYVFENGKWTKNKLNIRPSVRDSLILFHSKGFNNTNFKVVQSEKKIYFVLNGGGPVLQLKKDSIVRIDNSVEQKNQFGAATFVYKKKMYMYGGYGFWSFKNYTTYYDFSSNQWELFRTQSEIQPQSRWKPLFDLKDNELYVMGGRSSLPENYMTDIILKDLFVIDMDLKTIKNLSTQVNPKTPLLFHSHNNGFLLNNKRAYLYNNMVTAFDFTNNKFYSYNAKSLFEKKLEGSAILSFSDTLSFVKKIKGVKKLIFLNAGDIEKNFIESLPIILEPVEKSLFRKGAFALLCLFLMGFVYKLFSYKDYINKLIQYDDNWLYFSGNKARINTEQSQAIKLLELKGKFTSTELNKIVAKNKKYAKSHLTLLRKNFIKSLNELFSKLFDSDHLLITSSKLPKDKRLILYTTSKEIFKKDSFLKYMFKL